MRLLNAKRSLCFWQRWFYGGNTLCGRFSFSFEYTIVHTDSSWLYFFSMLLGIPPELGGFKPFWFSPLPGEMIPNLTIIFLKWVVQPPPRFGFFWLSFQVRCFPHHPKNIIYHQEEASKTAPWTSRLDNLFSVFHGIGSLGGGFKYFSFSSLFGEDSQFDDHIFQMGWFNHRLGEFVVDSFYCKL